MPLTAAPAHRSCNLAPTASRGWAMTDAPPAFLFVKVPTGRRDDDPLHEREERIDEALRATSLGTVLGWGASLESPHHGLLRRAAFTRIDIEVADLAPARTVLQQLLPTLDVPFGCEIHYTADGADRHDVWGATGWRSA